jgi:hypothetical protein
MFSYHDSRISQRGKTSTLVIECEYQADAKWKTRRWSGIEPQKTRNIIPASPTERQTTEDEYLEIIERALDAQADASLYCVDGLTTDAREEAQF